MQGEKRVLELLAEVLQKQDRTQEVVEGIQQVVEGTRQDIKELGSRMDGVETRLDRVIENQLAHQQILKALAANQQNSQKTLERIVDLLDTVTRMQRDQNRRLDRLENPDVAA